MTAPTVVTDLRHPRNRLAQAWEWLTWRRVGHGMLLTGWAVWLALTVTARTIWWVCQQDPHGSIGPLVVLLRAAVTIATFAAALALIALAGFALGYQ